MLKYTATDDRKLLDRLHNDIFGGAYGKSVGYVLYDGENPIGIAQMTVNPQVSVLEKIGITATERGKGNGDFFTRSLIWGLSNVSEEVVVNARSDYFAKFGFTEDGEGQMRCKSSRVTFPCDCHK